MESRIRELGVKLYHARNQFKSLHDGIVRQLSFKQYIAWQKLDSKLLYSKLNQVTKNKKLLKDADMCITLQFEITSLNIQYQTLLNQRPALVIVVNNNYSWYELTVRKLNKQASIEKRPTNHIGLRIVS